MVEKEQHTNLPHTNNTNEITLRASCQKGISTYFAHNWRYVV
jgi:hypothetical protein